MGHSQLEKAKSRERILKAAVRDIRGAGPDSVNIAALMKSASLTHGAFYSHFSSRSALIAAAIERALDESEQKFINAAGDKEKRTLQTIVEAYLSRAHSKNTQGGCAIACLAADAARGDDDMLELVASRLEDYVAYTADVIGEGPEAEQKALAAWCTMVGAITLSRLFRDNGKSDAVLHAAKQAILGADKG